MEKQYKDIEDIWKDYHKLQDAFNNKHLFFYKDGNTYIIDHIHIRIEYIETQLLYQPTILNNGDMTFQYETDSYYLKLN